MSRILLLIAVSAAFPAGASAQGLSLKVRTFSQGPDHPDTALNRELYDSLTQAATLRPGNSDRLPMHLYANAVSFATSSDEYMAVTMVEGFTMRPAAIDKGVEHQIWYAGWETPEDPDEGQFVREYVTREFLDDLVTISAMRTLVFPRSDLEKELNLYLDDLEYRYSCQAHNTCDQK